MGLFLKASIPYCKQIIVNEAEGGSHWLCTPPVSVTFMLKDSNSHNPLCLADCQETKPKHLYKSYFQL